MVRRPKVLNSIDWIDFSRPEQNTDVRLYKMQKDYSTSVKGCYVDFHIELGGTSVWHHVVMGEKLFFLIEPTKNNLESFTNWSLSEQQRSTFFANQVEECQLIELKEGNTLMIHLVGFMPFTLNPMHWYSTETFSTLLQHQHKCNYKCLKSKKSW